MPSLRACTAFLGLACICAPLTPQDTTLRMNVNLVSIFANVTDRNGAIVGGLTQNDFAVTEDGHPPSYRSISPWPLTLPAASRKTFPRKPQRRAVSHTPLSARRIR
jgi:hypothetical protein